MDLSQICKKYKLDDWELCCYKINCCVGSCVNNCAVSQDEIILKGEIHEQQKT